MGPAHKKFASVHPVWLGCNSAQLYTRVWFFSIQILQWCCVRNESWMYKYIVLCLIYLLRTFFKDVCNHPKIRLGGQNLRKHEQRKKKLSFYTLNFAKGHLKIAFHLFSPFVVAKYNEYIHTYIHFKNVMRDWEGERSYIFEYSWMCSKFLLRILAIIPSNLMKKS